MGEVSKTSSSALALPERDLMMVLESSLYPGASPESIKLVLGYCKASGLDPMQKPVHIVPMYDRNVGGYRDVVMPGIGLYRTQAARSGEYAGISEPEFGPDTAENIGGVDMTYPLWCRVTVSRRLPSGDIVHFTATERWKENYAVKGGRERSLAPNAMWAKRPYGQVAKCAEAQALRKAFPEIGSQPTADEMEGKTIEADYTVADQPKRGAPESLPSYSDQQFQENWESWQELISSGRTSPDRLIAKVESRYRMTGAQKQALRDVAPVPQGE